MMTLPTPHYDDGGITIYLGNCRTVYQELQDVYPVMAIDALITDPPYGTNNNSSRGGKHEDCSVFGDNDVSLRDWALDCIPFERALVFGSWKAPRPRFTKQVLIWEKGGHCGMGDLSIPWKPNHEEIYVLGNGFKGKRTSGVLYFIADRECNGIVRQRDHPTEKPLDLMKELISKTPGTILDPFMGSGTTLRAAKDLGRQCIGIEIEEKYCELAARRLQQQVLSLG